MRRQTMSGSSELPTDAIKQLFIKTDCDCEEECYCDDNHAIVELAYYQLQALLDYIALLEK